VGPQSLQAGAEIKQLCQLDLQLGFIGFGMCREDIQNQFTAVNYDGACFFFDISPLRRREIIIKNDEFRIDVLHHLFEFVQFPFSQAGGWMGGLPVLHQTAYYLDPRRFHEPFQFVECLIFIDMIGRGNNGNQNGSFCFDL